MSHELIDRLREAIQAPDSAQTETLLQQVEEKLQELARLEGIIGTFPLGHYYSPYPSVEEIQTYISQLNKPLPQDLPEINMNRPRQLALLERFAAYRAELPFRHEATPPLRYGFNNIYFGPSDVTVLYSMIRELQPARIIEVGCGFSSAAMLDVNELFFNNTIQCTFIEPEAERFRSILKTSDQNVRLLEQKLQDVDLSLFSELEANDILFVDSSHVAKIDSDVNYLFFQVLPRLRAGVYIHWHDIYYPFTLPADWVQKGWHWNEAFLLRAFLANNSQYEIQFFNSYLSRFHMDDIAALNPHARDHSGCSLWIKKTGAPSQ